MKMIVLITRGTGSLLSRQEILSLVQKGLNLIKIRDLVKQIRFKKLTKEEILQCKKDLKKKALKDSSKN